MRNQWGDKEAQESAVSLAPKKAPLTLKEAGLRMVEAWADSGKGAHWPVSFGDLRKVLERDYPDEYWERFKKSANKKEQRISAHPHCSCGSMEVVAVSKHGNFCSRCLHKNSFQE